VRVGLVWAEVQVKWHAALALDDVAVVCGMSNCCNRARSARYVRVIESDVKTRRPRWPALDLNSTTIQQISSLASVPRRVGSALNNGRSSVPSCRAKFRTRAACSENGRLRSAPRARMCAHKSRSVQTAVPASRRFNTQIEVVSEDLEIKHNEWFTIVELGLPIRRARIGSLARVPAIRMRFTKKPKVRSGTKFSGIVVGLPALRYSSRHLEGGDHCTFPEERRPS